MTRLPRRTAGALALAAVSLAAPAAASAQEELPAERLGELLERARDAGAAERFLGERYFLLDDPRSGESILRVIVEAPEDPATLVVDASLKSLGQRPPAFMNTQILLGRDGRVQAFRTHRRLGERTFQREARVTGDELRITRELRGGIGEREDVVNWHERAIPGLVVLFVLPCLHDLGVPFPCRLLQVDENTAKYGERLLTRAAPPEDPEVAGPRLPKLTLRRAAGDDAVQAEVRLDGTGRIRRLQKPSGATMTSIPAEKAERRLEEARRQAEAETPPRPPLERPPGAGGGGREGGDAHGDDAGDEGRAGDAGDAGGGADEGAAEDPGGG